MARLSCFLLLIAILSAFLTGCSDSPVESIPQTEISQIETGNSQTGKQNVTGKTEVKDHSETEQQESQEENPADTNTIPAYVLRVVDGDTFEAIINGKEETVRLILVDTPETVHPSKPTEPFGPEASQFAKETLEGQDVRLELDVSERDQYGRVLAYVWIGDKMINEMLLEKGLARVAVFPPDVKYVDRFREIEKEAQRKGIGIWSVENYAIEEQKTNENNIAKNISGNCDEPKIKGNINSKGEKIYHVPGGQFYDVTNPEEMFCSEEEAQAAGYRKSKR
jgi:micrococcal nuclease